MTEQQQLCEQLQVGWRVWFVEEIRSYTVQARSKRYIICTKPFAIQKTVVYTIIDTEEEVRGPDNMVFGGGYETREDCEQRLLELEGKHPNWPKDSDPMEVSRRKRIPCNILKISNASGKVVT